MLGLGTGIVKSNLYGSEYLTAVFDGTDDFITVPDNDALSFTSSTGFGISFWINLSEIANHGIINKFEEYNFFIRYVSATNVFQYEFSVIDDSEDQMYLGIATRTPVINEWVHILLQYQTDKRVRVYVNNILDDIFATQANYVDIENTSNDLLIGKAQNTSAIGTTLNQFITGAMTNLHIYSGNLSSAERTNVYNASPTGDFNSLVNNTIIASYLLTSNLNDSSGNGHNGSSASGQSPTFTTV